MNRITAEEARELAGPTVQDHVETAYKLIRTAAEKKQHHVDLKSDFWASGGYKKDKEYLEAVSILEKDGFRVWFFYEEKQFVDMYTIVEW